MTPAWDDQESPDTQWGDPEAWRGGLYPAAEEGWAPDPTLLWAPIPAEEPPFIIEDDLLEDDEDWCPGSWLEEWGSDEG